VETGADTDSNAGSADPQYRDVETGEQLNGDGVTVTLELGEERVLWGLSLMSRQLHRYQRVQRSLLLQTSTSDTQ